MEALEASIGDPGSKDPGSQDLWKRRSKSHGKTLEGARPWKG